MKRGERLRELEKHINTFQSRAHNWAITCFDKYTAHDKRERGHRFFEEAVELIQACDIPKSEAIELIDYVYGRPKGEIDKEAGSTFMTLAILCEACGVVLQDQGHDALEHAWTNLEKIREKWKAKPKFGALP
jgi:hypothetical protein